MAPMAPPTRGSSRHRIGRAASRHPGLCEARIIVPGIDPFTCLLNLRLAGNDGDDLLLPLFLLGVSEGTLLRQPIEHRQQDQGEESGGDETANNCDGQGCEMKPACPVIPRAMGTSAAMVATAVMTMGRSRR